MSLQSEAFALIALLYYYRNSASRQLGRSIRPRDVLVIILPLVMVAIPFLVPTFTLATEPYFSYAGLADLSFYMRIFNMAVIAYIFKSTIASLVKGQTSNCFTCPRRLHCLGLNRYS